VRPVVGRTDDLGSSVRLTRSAGRGSAGTLRGVVDVLLRWYERERRDLPWRRTRDPYAILVSEVMLQQTQVARVVPRYEAWIERWPTAASLAATPLEEVLRAWVGLGYNRRAVRLWEAARVVAHEGWPQRLQDLPGVGPYTAAAVGSFAFDRQEIALDTNVRRLFARLGRDLEPPAGRAADFNQATMELGATVCTAPAPRCGVCPLRSGCDGPEAAGREAQRVHGRVRERFEDSNRWVRGRVVAGLAAGEPLPEGIAPERLERALQGLLRDGLIRRTSTGFALG
jgi:A/G-specific adenine glycosylase